MEYFSNVKINRDQMHSAGPGYCALYGITQKDWRYVRTEAPHGLITAGLGDEAGAEAGVGPGDEAGAEG